MRVNVNCKKNVDGPWCKDERVKRSLFGFGARCCPVFNGGRCAYQEEYPVPSPPKGQSGIKDKVINVKVEMK